MNVMRVGIVAVVTGLGMMLAGVAGAGTIWSIGHNDGSYREFAIPGAHGEYSAAFPQDVKYVAGKSVARKEWPFIQPGPADDWAGSKTHPFVVEFKVKKKVKDACRLMVYLSDTQGGSPPVLSVKVNDQECPAIQLPAGAGDASLTNAKAGRPLAQPFVFPGKWLHKGMNTITLTTTSGSWLLYDAVTLEAGLPSAPEVTRIAAMCTPMFKKVDGVLKQAVRVEVQNVGLEGTGQLRLKEVAGSEQSVELRPGVQACFLLVTPFAAAGKQRVQLTVGEATKEAEFDAAVEKPLKLFVAASTHTDIGYTDLQEKCMELHVNNAMISLETSKTNPDFKYNLEVFAQADWIKELKPEAVPALEQAIRDQKMGLTALYLNMLTGLCSGEEMMWLLRPAQTYGRSLGVAVDMASLNDVPTSVGTLPMFLKAAGVRYFAEAINEDRGPVFSHADAEMNQSPFWWEAPDGSRVLALLTRTYFQVCQINMQNSVAAMEEALPRFLGRFMRPDYPSDAVFINGGFVDNTVMNPHYAEVAAEWNRTWDFPQVVIGTPSDYFRYVEENFGNDLPVYRGDMGVFWEDGAASSALETSMARWAKADLCTAEKWLTLAGARNKKSGDTLDTYAGTWKEILYYDEHTWGSAVSISDPNNPQTAGQWVRKASYADRSLKQGRAWGARGEDALRRLAHAGKSKDGNSLLVSNPFSWARDIVVTLPAGAKGKSVRDTATGKSVPAQSTADGGVCFMAAKVPAMGYRVYAVEADGEAGKALLSQAGDDYTWKTANYEIHIDPKTGGLDRITEIATGKEWVDPKAGYTLNQFLYVKGGTNSSSMVHPNSPLCTDLQFITHETASVSLAENGPARAVLHIQRSGANVSAVDTDVVFHADGTLDVVNVLHKQETLEKEAGYFVFPFGLNAPDEAQAFMELPYGMVEADTEQMPGACREWYCVNTFAAAGNATGSAYVASPDTPLFCVGDVNRGLWPGRINGNRHVLYAYAFNNYWHTNYKASQGGDIRCAYSVKLSNAPFDPVTATRFGWARVLDMTPGRTGAVAADSPGAAEQSFAALDKGPIVLSELLPVEGGVLVRLYNPSREAARTPVNLRGITPKAILLTDLLGQNGKAIEGGGKVTVPARGIATVVLTLK